MSSTQQKKAARDYRRIRPDVPYAEALRRVHRHRVEVWDKITHANEGFGYFEFVAEDWSHRPEGISQAIEDEGGIGPFKISLPILDAIPSLRQAWLEELRAELPLVFEEASAANPDRTQGIPHPNDLSDQDLLERWYAADDKSPVYGDGVLDAFGSSMFADCVVREFPGVQVGGDNSLYAWINLVDPTGTKTRDDVYDLNRDGGLHTLLHEEVPE